MLWTRMKVEQVAVRLASVVAEVWSVSRSCHSSARAGQDRQLVRQTAARERSNTARAAAGRRGSDQRMLSTTARLTASPAAASVNISQCSITQTAHN